MNISEFRQCLKTFCDGREGDRIVTRTYPGPLSMTDLVLHLPQSSWDYADWLESTGLRNTRLFLFACECEPKPGTTMAERLMDFLWEDACMRFKRGEDLPFDGPPPNYALWFQPANQP